MTLPRLAIKHPVSTLMLMLICIVFGVVSLAGTSMELMPKINPPIVVIMTVFPGASPQEVGRMVTEPLEEVVATTPGLTDLTSTSRENLSLLILQFNWGTNMSEARSDVQQALERTRLPEGVQKPALMKFDPNAMPIVMLSVTDGQDLSELKSRLDREVKPRLEKVNGVAAVGVTGAPDREIRVLLNPERLKQYGVTQSQISGIIQASQISYPAGKITLDEEALNLRIIGKASDVEALKSLIVTLVPDLPGAARTSGTTGSSGAFRPGIAGSADGTPTVPQTVPGGADMSALLNMPGISSLIGIQGAQNMASGHGAPAAPGSTGAPGTSGSTSTDGQGASSQGTMGGSASTAGQGANQGMPAQMPAQLPAQMPIQAIPGAQGLPAGFPGLTGGSLPTQAQQISLKPVRLREVAEVMETHSDITLINRTNGNPSLRVTIQKEGEANTVDVTRAVNRELERLRRDYPGLEVVSVFDQGDMIQRAVRSVSNSLLGGAILAILILLLFLRNWRPTFIISIAIPFSIIVTFVLVFLSRLTLNIMTLGGLALGVGMLVDNAIVVIENIHRRMVEFREPPAEAAEKGAGEVARAITSSTLTTVAVFLPVVFISGLTGELFKELALTVTFSLLASLAVALTVVPMLASRLLKTAGGEGLKDTDRRKNAYTRTLGWALRHRALVLGLTGAFVLLSVLMIPRVGTEFVPTPDEGAFSVTVQVPPGISLNGLNRQVQRVADVIRQEVPTRLIETTAGQASQAGAMMSSGFGGDGTVRVILPDNYSLTAGEAMEKVRKALLLADIDAALTFSLDNAAFGGNSQSNRIQVMVSGPDSEVVKRLTDNVQNQLNGISGVVSVENNLDAARPEFQVLVSQDRAMRHGLTPIQLAMTVADAVKGRVATRIQNGERSVDVRVMYRPEDVSETAKLENMWLRTPRGQDIRLKEVASVERAYGPVSITRENQKISTRVSGLIEGRDLGSITSDINRMIRTMEVPAGYTVKASGASQMMSEGIGSMSRALVLSVLLIYMIMASQFESLRHPFIILFTMPLAVSGVVFGLLLTGYALGITAMVGIVVLAGIVVNNGIVLVDFINLRRQEGLRLNDAIIEAGRTRLRPILMTAVTTILGLLPLALGLGEGANMQAPMGVAVIGGLATSTLLTLVVIPVVYSLVAAKDKA